MPDSSKNSNRRVQNRATSQARSCIEAFRKVASDAFFRCRPADRTLSAYFRGHRELGARDRRFILETVFATFRWWGTLVKSLSGSEKVDFDSRFSASRPDAPDKVWPSTRTAARLLAAAASIDRQPITPPLAALADLAGHSGGIPEPCLPEVVPAWTFRHLMPGADHDTLCQWLQKRPPMWLRSQSDDFAGLCAELSGEGLKPAAHEAVRGAISVGVTRVNLYSLASFRAGKFEVQDLASQTIGLACRPGAGQRWWDACAGAGGKSLQLASIMKRKGAVVASDIRPRKLDDLRKRSRRAGFPNIRCRSWDGKPLDRRRANFDGVLVDAPCTCSGTWRRNPAARWQVAENEIEEMAEVQLQIVLNAISALRPGGVMVFATCSMFREENIENVERILARTPLELEPFDNPFGGRPTDGTLQVWPWDGDCDAMFVARFRLPV